MITIIDYDCGNKQVLFNHYKRLGIEVNISNDINIIEKASKIILPGVGSFDEVMDKIYSFNLYDILNHLVLDKKIPILGICVGMQIFFDGSSEGNRKGFSWISGTVTKLEPKYNKNIILPHMGWNTINIKKNNSLFKDINTNEEFYFLHSYCIKEFTLNEKSTILSTTIYDTEFVSSINKENIYGTQFHPEKSHNYGIKILNNFATEI